jgi:hypothetical protein
VQYPATYLRPGDCIEPLPENSLVTVVPCAEPHSAEFATTYVLAEGPWPGMSEIRRLSENGCGPRMRYRKFKSEELSPLMLVPIEADWPKYRTVYCLAASRDGGKLRGRVIR